ncbi:hypothetical protein Tco_1043170 [Tanacetum coccineum]|uniref:Uncharacterized protein n=1 Tax=Tanacetum coccineum TaxID=301880 RepID=A0ABQ5GLA1_9ASTR
MSEPHIEKPEATLISSTQTISSSEFTNQFLNETAKPQPPQTKRSKTKVLLKKSKKPESQVDTDELDSRVTRLEKTVNAMSRFNLPDAIDEFAKAHLKNIIRKDVLDFAMFDALALSLSMDEDDTDRVIDEPPSHKKRHRDDQDHDPSSDLSKEKKKRKQKGL